MEPGESDMQIPQDMTNCGFLQIYTDNFVSTTLYGPRLKTVVFVTGEKSYLKKWGMYNDDCFQRTSQNKFINILKTYPIPFDSVKLIFQHAKDKILNAKIKNGIIKIIGDTGVLFSMPAGEGDPELHQEIVLSGSKVWLTANGLSFF